MTFRIFLPVAAIAAVLAVHQIVPTIYPEDYEAVVYPAFLKLCLGLAGVFTVLIFVVIFSLLMSLLFKVRDRVLKWQKGSVRW